MKTTEEIKTLINLREMELLRYRKSIIKPSMSTTIRLQNEIETLKKQNFLNTENFDTKRNLQQIAFQQNALQAEIGLVKQLERQ